MSRSFMKWSYTENGITNHVHILLWDIAPQDSFSIMYRAKDENMIRQILSTLKHTKHGTFDCLPPINEIYLHKEADGYIAIWIYTQNWESRASFLAGVLVGKGII